MDRSTAIFVDGLGAAAATSGILSQLQGLIFALLHLQPRPVAHPGQTRLRRPLHGHDECRRRQVTGAVGASGGRRRAAVARGPIRLAGSPRPASRTAVFAGPRGRVEDRDRSRAAPSTRRPSGVGRGCFSVNDEMTACLRMSREFSRRHWHASSLF